MFNTRIAPSPSGSFHLGTARTAYFNWLAARCTGGKFILRIDDTDIERSKQEYVDVIFQAMDWLGLNYDAVVYQSQRGDFYSKFAQSLVSNGYAKVLDDGAIIFAPNDLIINEWRDSIAGTVKVTKEDLDFIRDMVLIRSNGSPTYHFASCVDDWDLGINFIIRGVDHITNTSRHVYLFTAFAHCDLHRICEGFTFAHVGLIHYQGKKLSKRDGASSVLSYRDQNYDPDALLNFLVRMGWGPIIDDKTTKLLPKERMLQLFIDGGKMKSSSANMDLVKLDSFNRKYKAIKNDRI